jgi:hypothetical protein
MMERDEQEEEVKGSHFCPPNGPGIKVADFKVDEESDE